MALRHARFVGFLLVATLAASGCQRGEAQAPAAGGGAAPGAGAGGGAAPGAGAGGGAGRAGGAGGRGAGPAVPVTIAQAQEKDVPREINAIGTAEASQIISVRAQITGVLTTVNFKEGDDVQKGQVLFELDPRPLQAALDQAKASLQRDVTTAAQAKITADRYQDLVERGIATRDQYDQSRASAVALAATVDADKAAVENADVQLLYTTIRSEVSGRTGQLAVHLGNLVRNNDATPLVTINQISPINVTFGIPESQLPDLKKYLAQGLVHVEAAPPNETRPSQGSITFIDNSVDLTTGTIKIKGSFTNEDRRLWPGQFCNVIVRLTTDPNAIIVPTVAVQQGQQGSYVFVVKDDKTVDLRPVVVARTQGDNSLIKDGLKPGETVVTDGQLRLVPGSRIVVRTEKAAS